MPKQVVIVNDFSGGIAKGYSPENLKNNQMQKCDNLIADGVGKLSTIPKTETKSTSDVVSSLPVYNAKNIHTWSSDTSFTVQDQASNIMSAPTTSEIKKGYKARWVIHMTRSSEFNQPQFVLKDMGRNGAVVFNWNFPIIKGWTGSSQQSLGKTLQGLDVNIHQDETISNPSYMSEHVNYKWLTHSEMENLFDKDATNVCVYTVQKVAYEENPTGEELYYHWNESSSDYHGGDFKVTAIKESLWNSSSNESFALRACIEFDYWGPMDLQFETSQYDAYRPFSGWQNGSLEGALRLTIGTSAGTSGSYLVEYSDFHPEAIEEVDFIQAPTDDSVGANLDGASTDRYFVSNMNDAFEHAHLFGQFSRWDYVLTGIANNEIATYNLTLELFTAPDLSTDISITVSHISEPGETAESIKTSLLTKLLEEVAVQAPDQMVNYEWKEDGSGFEIFQDEDTPKPYAIKALTSSKTNVTTQSDIQTGQEFSDLLILANENASASIYSLSSDNWLDYPLDLRLDTSIDYDTPLTFSDTEGFLKVSDQYFYNNSIPKWFGYLNLNDNVYINNTFDVSGAFYDDRMTPVPFTETASSGDLNGQYSHEFIVNNLDSTNTTRYFQVSSDTADDATVDLPTLGANTPAPSGLKLFVDWIDGANTGTSYTKIDGSFTMREDAKFYYVYKYHGGAISQPQPFQNSEATTVTAGNSPRVDNVALGLSLSMGGNMINGDGNDMINVRLKGIEVYGYFPLYKPNDLLLLLEIDLKRGWKAETTGDWATLKTIETAQNAFNCYTTCLNADTPQSELPIFKTHPSISFFDKYRISWNKPIGFDTGGTGWKTSCVYNRKAYYGNVRLKGEDDTITYYPDGIVKSVQGHYDAVSVDNVIEATINDGDEISCLRVAGNKLMQFKKKSLTIMGIKILENGETREVIEQTIDHCGVSGENQVTSTPYGVFWVTRSGIYIFDGNSLQKLTENLQGSTISKTEWEDFYGPRTHVGYDAYWNQAHICKDTQNNPKTLIYAFNTRAFTESNKLYASDHKTGFVNDSEGHLLWGQIGTGSNSITTNANNNPRQKDKTRQVATTYNNEASNN